MIDIVFGGRGGPRFGVQLSRPEAVALRDKLNAVLGDPSIQIDRTNPAHAAQAVERAKGTDART